MARRKQSSDKTTDTSVALGVDTLAAQLLKDVRTLILQARERLAVSVNSELTLLYWHIGGRIRQDVLGSERAEYGQQILATLSQQLIREFGKGFAVSALSRMMTFTELFPEEAQVRALAQQHGTVSGLAQSLRTGTWGGSAYRPDPV
jgi:hypothetical protein